MAMTNLQLASEIVFRASKRGLVIADPTGETLLFEHPRAHQLPALLHDFPTPEELTARLGPPLQAGFIEDLLAAGILTNADITHEPHTPTTRRLRVDRSGVQFPGIATPSSWIHRRISPVIGSWPGRIALGVLLVAGIACFAAGSPSTQAATAHPATRALLILVLGLLTTVLHEFGHAVALVHYGRVPRRAGLGFYWGSLSFFVDSTPALTLPRHQRVVQALAGLGVDVVTTSTLAILAHILHNPLLAVAFWQRAVLDAVAIVINAVPVLEVDGHWALADYLDEPDLSPRARAALAETVRARRPSAGYPMAAYGAISLAAGLALIATSAVITWHILGSLATALLHGNITDILIGAYLIGPILIGLTVSILGLILQSTMARPT